MNPMTAHCDTCRFWFPESGEGPFPTTPGCCRRRAPVVSVAGVSVWPVTYAEDGCGDYAKKPTKASPEVEPIRVWFFYEAPPELQALSGHGGDEDWLALVPNQYQQHYLPWLDVPAFGCCDVSQHQHPDYPDCTIYISAHA